MTWSYRVCKTPDGLYSIREVYYNEKDEPDSWTEAILDGYEDSKEIYEDLQMMMRDVIRHSVVEIPEDGGDDPAPNK